MTKPICIIQGPYATRSGYGDMARDICRHIIEMDEYDVKLVSMPWGNTPMNALNTDNLKDVALINNSIQPPIQLPRQPELYINISVPNEWQPMGKYNIGITAGIETTLASSEWIEGCNRMDLVVTISEHSKRILEQTQIQQKDQAGNIVKELKLEKPIEVLHNCVDLSIFRKLANNEVLSSIKNELAKIKEEFCFLFVGHWLNGNVGEDRKNVGLLVKIFCETFKNKGTGSRPALILKTSSAGFSILDREEILKKIEQIRASCGANAPNVYLLHGELTEQEMNSLYNHPKVKAHVSFTKGEGFGRPLLEATMSQKPVIASGWSGHLDFLNPQEALLIGGELKNVDPGVVWPGVIIAESQWFNIDHNIAANAMNLLFKRYDNFLENAKALAKKNREQFSYQAIFERTKELLHSRVPKFAMPVPLKLPELKKIS